MFKRSIIENLKLGDIIEIRDTPGYGPVATTLCMFISWNTGNKEYPYYTLSLYFIDKGFAVGVCGPCGTEYNNRQIRKLKQNSETNKLKAGLLDTITTSWSIIKSLNAGDLIELSENDEPNKKSLALVLSCENVMNSQIAYRLYNLEEKYTKTFYAPDYFDLCRTITKLS